MNPYETLGVPDTASPAQIKAAYRRRAKETHPDKGSDGAEFALVAKAYAVLSDPEMRARYDEGGGIDDTSTHTIHQRMVAILASLLAQALNETAQQGQDVKRINYVEHMRRNCAQNLAEIRKNVAVQRRMLADATILLKRVTRKGDGENVFVDVLKQRVEQLTRPLAENDLNLKALERMEFELSHYTNEVEIVQAFTVMRYGVGAFNQQTSGNYIWSTNSTSTSAR